ncbi:hypothetical protein BB559_007548 [Furculomyces boomerangus]|uniref:Uncharacterized protein n=1 Tax=Furculomyces boomerangus TaxID=61424 RepID=A0A2T9XWX5_9FUNG|nr:hypothetical protein BB559_007548 [Furculomyces boomerangus]
MSQDSLKPLSKTLPTKFFSGRKGRVSLPYFDSVYKRPGSDNSFDREIEIQFFRAIEGGENEKARNLITKNRSLTRATNKEVYYRYDPELEISAYRFLGAYIGPVTGVQLALLLGNDKLAIDLIDASFEQDLEVTFGNGNTSLHLAAFLEAVDVVKALLVRDVNTMRKNRKNLTSSDVTSNLEILNLLRVATVKRQQELLAE